MTPTPNYTHLRTTKSKERIDSNPCDYQVAVSIDKYEMDERTILNPLIRFFAKQNCGGYSETNKNLTCPVLAMAREKLRYHIFLNIYLYHDSKFLAMNRRIFRDLATDGYLVLTVEWYVTLHFRKYPLPIDELPFHRLFSTRAATVFF